MNPPTPAPAEPNNPQRVFITADELLRDAFELAAQVHTSGYQPTLILGIWRGGTPIAAAIHEFFDYLSIPANHFAIRTSSYQNIDQRSIHVAVQPIMELLSSSHITWGNGLAEKNAYERILLVDDVFDTGRTIEAVIQEIRRCRGNDQDTIKVATPWFKPSRNKTQLAPHYSLKQTDDWLIFPHELKGLSLEEIAAHKGSAGAALSSTLRSLQKP